MTELLIGSEWVPAAGSDAHELIDPTHRTPLATIRHASPAQRQQAYDAAQRASSTWAAYSNVERAAAVGVIVDEIRQAAGALAERQAIESGQPLRECQDLVASAVRRLRLPVGSEPPRGAPTEVRRLSRHNLWLFWEDALKAVAAGNTMVCELPADRALAALAIARCARGLPPGVLNVVTVAADANAGHSNVATDFVFVGQGCDLEVAVAGAATLRLYNTGQRVGQSARIHVEASLAYRFADRLHEYLAFLEAGDPRKPVTDLGPLDSEPTLQRALDQIGQVLKQGALVRLGGRQYQPWGLRGYFLQPTLLIEGSGAERAAYECISGPIVIVSPTTDIGSALRESVGDSTATVRLAAFTANSAKLEESLRAANFEPRLAGTRTALVDRTRAVGDPAAVAHRGVEIERVDEPQPDWFPYASRRGMKL